MTIPEILSEVSRYNTKHVLLTGGEPLLQRPVGKLVSELKGAGLEVSIETHGEVSIREAAPHARIVMDIKTPSSGMSRGGYKQNLAWLKPTDEVKFVIASKEDYEWAKAIIDSKVIPTHEILLSPALLASGQPGSFQPIEATWLAEQILKDGLPVRLQIQLHKLLWGRDQRGV